jgi:putative ABC transport system permease protein
MTAPPSSATPLGAASRPRRSLASLAMALIRQWWPQVAALTAACAVVATTIAGAVGVGASLTRGLRTLALERLGGIEAAVVADEPFTRGLGARLATAVAEEAGAGSADAAVPDRVVPALVLSVSVDATGSAGGRRGVRATLLACDELAGLGFAATPSPPGSDAAIVNGPLAAALGAEAGDVVVLRIPQRSAVPSDSPLGRRTATSSGRRLRITEVLPDAGLGRFSLRPVQVTGPLIVTSLATAQAILRRGDVANVVFASRRPAGAAGSDAARTAAGSRGDAATWLQRMLRPSLVDYGLALEAADDETMLRLVSRRLILPPEADRVAAEILRPLGGTPSLVFLANSMGPATPDAAAPAGVPYSTVAGVEATTLPCGTLAAEDGTPLPRPGPDDVIIDRWMADDLLAQGADVTVGTRLELRFFMPETRDGRVEETMETLRISGIAAMTGAATARSLVPEVEGITDEASIADWDPPFPFDRSRVRTSPPHDEDDRYWKAYGPTPKAFVALETARRFAGSRFGETTAWLLPRERDAGTDAADNVSHADVDALRERLAAALVPERLGIRVEPLAADALAAARGSTPFGGLFLALSSFLVMAGLLLEWLLFQLLVAARRRDVGLLAAIGWSPGRIAALLVMVGGAAAVVGAALGMLAGPLWAELLVTLLGRSWSDVVTTAPVAAFSAGPPQWSDLWPAGAAAAGLSLTALAWAAVRAGRLSPLAALRENGGPEPVAGAGSRGASSNVSASRPTPTGAALGPADCGKSPPRPFSTKANLKKAKVFQGSQTPHPAADEFFHRLLGPAGRRIAVLAGGLLAAAVGMAFAARGAGWQAAVGLFFGSGLLALVGLLLLVRWWLGGAPAVGPPRTLAQLAGRGLAWRPGRAFSVAAIVAVAQFLIVAVSSFALRPPADPHDRSSPTGGWTEIATFGEPTPVDPADPQTRAALGLTASAEAVLADCTIVRLRSSAGDDASCTNLYATTRPTVLGIGADFIDRGGFRFVGHAGPPAAAANPWTLLSASRPSSGPVPAILDQATAQWALQLGGIGAVFTLADEAGRDVPCQIVGLLDAGILQGFVIVGEADFRRLFPSRSGYGMALIDASGVAPDRRGAVAPAVRAAWADAGTSVEGAVERLRSLQAVQNTFLGGFQALGTLGLLLGTAGVAAVQVQNVLERRGQLAVLRAIGFTTLRLRSLLMLETLLTVGLGLIVGTAAGLLAVSPLLAGTGTARLPLGWIGATCGLSLAAALLAGLAAASRHTIPIRPRAE